MNLDTEACEQAKEHVALNRIRKQIITAMLLKFGSAPIHKQSYFEFREEICKSLGIAQEDHGLNLDDDFDHVIVLGSEREYVKFTEKALALLKEQVS